MMHPVGPLTPAIYWRRRVALLIAVVVALFLLSKVVSAFGSSNASAAGPGPSHTSAGPAASGHSSSASVPPLVITTPSRSRSAGATGAASNSHRSSSPVVPSSSATPSSRPTSGGSSSGSASAAPAATAGPCSTSQVQVTAISAETSFAVGEHPVLGLQATNVGSAPCSVTLSDASVQLQVYSGESRVWGSADCPNTSDTPAQQVLAPRVPLTVHITWLGTTSTPGCQGTRQPVSAGTYTLYATLGGRNGTATQFAFH